MNLNQKASALESMIKTTGWKVLKDYLEKNSTPVIIPIDSLDSAIKQAYKNGVCQGHREVLDFIKITIEAAKRNKDIFSLNNPYKPHI
ncbi:MAG: hypothetical protein AB1782_04595 [Cyanobacteriota bacterium]